MKKLSLLVLMLALTMCSIGTYSIVYAEEVEDTEIVELVNEETTVVEEETEQDYIRKTVEYIIAGVLGLLGTSAVAVLFRKQLKGLILSITDGLKSVKDNKDKTEEVVTDIVNKANKVIASLEMCKDELYEASIKDHEELKAQVSQLSKVILCMASGLNELVINGTSESICNALKEVDINGSEKVQ